jgi:hypothetical protein
LRKIEYFKRVHIDDSNYSICWPNGADFSPDVLFEAGKEVKIKGCRRSSLLKKGVIKEERGMPRKKMVKIRKRKTKSKV